MKLTILTDNSAGPHFLAEHGLSYYIEADIQVLFDAGASDVFLRNAEKLGMTLQPKFIVLSHGHWDHGNGLQYLSSGTLVCHPACFTKRYSKKHNRYTGLDFSLEQAQQKFTVELTEQPKWLSEEIVYLGYIPRIVDFEAKRTDFVDASGNEDFIPDDSGIAIKTQAGLVIVSGCAHAGICNTIEFAKQVTGVNKIVAVFGGFHLKAQNGQSIRTIQYIEKNGITQVYPSHCTSLPALSLFYQKFKLPQPLTGNYYIF
jgi:7,8-dihydropterin-6-yl-methyl-4-(beta-D-ribofuranosyl)aminobenzene 5'-phosphate synthase